MTEKPETNRQDSQGGHSLIRTATAYAHRYPRSEAKCLTRIKKDCKIIAGDGFNKYENEDGDVYRANSTLAKEIARCWTHIDFGILIKGYGRDRAFFTAYAWDMETHNISRRDFSIRYKDAELSELEDPDEKADENGCKWRELINIRSTVLICRVILNLIPDHVTAAAVVACREGQQAMDGQRSSE